MTLKGVYSYDPNLQQVSEIEGLSQFMKSGAAGFSRTGPPDPLTRREYLPTHIKGDFLTGLGRDGCAVILLTPASFPPASCIEIHGQPPGRSG